MKQQRENTSCQREGLRGGRENVFPCWNPINLNSVESSHTAYLLME